MWKVITKGWDLLDSRISFEVDDGRRVKFERINGMGEHEKCQTPSF